MKLTLPRLGDVWEDIYSKYYFQAMDISPNYTIYRGYRFNNPRKIDLYPKFFFETILLHKDKKVSK